MTEEIDIPAPTSSGSSSLPVFSAKSGTEDFLDPDNLCGQNLLRLTARGSSIVAELLRLSTNIPDSLLGPEKTRDPEQLKYNPVLFDFQYLRAAEDYEKKLNDDVDLLDLDLIGDDCDNWAVGAFRRQSFGFPQYGIVFGQIRPQSQLGNI